jgi:uncharacterized membrane protein
LIGVIFLNPLIGVALGAASGALGGALTDYGINDAFMKELAANLKPGDAALFVLIQNMTADKVVKEILPASRRPPRSQIEQLNGKVSTFLPLHRHEQGCCHGLDEAVILAGEIA